MYFAQHRSACGTSQEGRPRLSTEKQEVRRQHRLTGCNTCCSTRLGSGLMFHSEQTGTDLRSSGKLRSKWWQVPTDISGQPIGPTFKGQEIQGLLLGFLDHRIWNGSPSSSFGTTTLCGFSPSQPSLSKFFCP